MKTIRYSEIFYSFQGEAEMMGTPAVWLRFFGCNLNCSGFGQKNPTDPSTYVLPYKDFDENSVKSVEDLPVWKTGCDSSYSWAAKFKHLAHDATVEEVCDRLIDQMRSPTNPNGLFQHPVTGQGTIMSFTGGEPMLYQDAMVAIMEEFIKRGNYPHIVNCETNGTRRLDDALTNFILDNSRQRLIRWHWSMSPKLHTVSGELDAVDVARIHDYFTGWEEFDHVTGVLKFVVNGTEECWNELAKYVEQLDSYFQDPEDGGMFSWSDVPDIYVMPVGATKDDQEQPEIGDMCIEAMKRGYKVAPRVQCYVFGNVIGR
jgi:organic radical activating enzyme